MTAEKRRAVPRRRLSITLADQPPLAGSKYSCQGCALLLPEGLGFSCQLDARPVGGAKALLRDDLGRLAAGARADIVLVDLKQPEMVPARDPLRSLVFHAADRAVRHVFVAGRQVVSDGQVLNLDHRGAAERLTEAQGRMMTLCPTRDYRGRSVDELTPLSLPLSR
jgi:hypothetical protein